MKVLITGVCGFVGFSMARSLGRDWPEADLIGIDNLSRRGSEQNLQALEAMGVRLIHGDIRNTADCEALPPIDYVIDAAANASVLAGKDGMTTARQLLDINLTGTLNLLELCRRDGAGFVLLSTSRVYGIEPLTGLSLRTDDQAFTLDGMNATTGLSAQGIDETFSTEAPLSLYGASKRAAEQIALEYHHAFDIPVWINRCGVIAGAGQLGHPGQGIFSYWVHAWSERRPLKYIGFGGHGHQVRDCLHPQDLADLVMRQMRYIGKDKPRLVNVGGGTASARSLAQVSNWCRDRFGYDVPIKSSAEDRPYDLPWVVLDTSLVREHWGWYPRWTTEDILEGIASFAENHPDWLARCGVVKTAAAVHGHATTAHVKQG